MAHDKLNMKQGASQLYRPIDYSYHGNRFVVGITDVRETEMPDLLVKLIQNLSRRTKFGTAPVSGTVHILNIP